MCLCLLCTSLQVHDGSLTILGITRDDRGAYTCRAYSDQGEVLHTTRLLVQGTVSMEINSVPFNKCRAEKYMIADLCPQPNINMCISTLIYFPPLCLERFTVEGFYAAQASCVLMYVTYILSQSVALSGASACARGGFSCARPCMSNSCLSQYFT